MQAHSPGKASSRPYNVVVAHCVGLAAGFGGVFVCGITYAPSVFMVHAVSASRVCAATLAITVATAIELLLRATHPPAASTTLLAALGSFHPTWHDTATVVAGILIVAAIGEIARFIAATQKLNSDADEQPHDSGSRSIA